VTNDLRIGVRLAGNPNIELISTGGIARAAVYSLVGPETINFLRSIRVDTTFIAADAVHPDGGVYNNIPEETGVKKAMIQAAEKVILVADSSKFEARGFARVCELEKIDTLITDSGASESILDRFKQTDLELRVVQEF
jgi:DeoR/GlpR family transcriptional regulator of sugar metabolism